MEILKFFGFHGTCYKPNDYSRLENDESGTKFLLNYNQHLKDLNDLSQYDTIYAKFEKLVDEYKSSVKFDDTILKRTINTNILEAKKAALKHKIKKRSAYNANITVINEEDESENGEVSKTSNKLYEDHFFFKSDEIVTGNIKALKNQRVLMKQASVDIPDSTLVVKKGQPPKKKHRPSESFVTDETTHFVDAESTIQLSTVGKSIKKKQQKSKLGTNVKKIKKNKSKSDQFKVTTADNVNSTSVFQPKDVDLKNKNMKFIKDGDVNPFNKLKPSSEASNTDKSVLNNRVKTILKTVEKKSPSKGKIGELKTLFENLAKKTKEKLKEKDVTKTKIPRVSDPKSMKKRKSRLSVAKQQKTKKKSINGVKAFINDNIINKEKLQKFNEIKNSIIQKQTIKTPGIKTAQKSQKLDLLASKCVTLKKLNVSCVPTVANKKPVKDFIKLNKLNMTSMSKKPDLSMNKSINHSSLFYQAKNEQSTHVYKALNDYAVDHLSKNNKPIDKTKNNGNIANALDKMVTQKTVFKQRQGSTSTISTYSSLDSTFSVNDQTFKSANSKFSAMNSTISSIITNDKTSIQKTKNSTMINRVNLNATKLSKVVNKNNPMNKSTLAVNHSLHKSVKATPSKKIAQKINQFENKKLLTVPEPSCTHSNKKPVVMPSVPTIKITTPNLVDYNIEDLNSGDETDDDEEPNKPIPEWAEFSLVTKKVLAQNKGYINFTKLFKGSSNDQIDLSNIFVIQRNRFNVRTSSAHWECPPIWQTEGIKGNESFRNQ